MMKKQTQVIFSHEWMNFHPYQVSAPSDLYYIRLSNKVFDTINELLDTTDSKDYLFLSKTEQIDLSCTLTCYFEDIISETNIWQSFTREHERVNRAPIPFYINEDYIADEINENDIRFLCWHFFTQLEFGQIPISPNEQLFEKIAKAVYPIFDDAFETAPVNEKLKEFFIIKEGVNNLYELQSMFFWVGTSSYLYHGNEKKMEFEIEEVLEIAKENNLEEKFPQMANMVCNDFAYNNVTEFFGDRSAGALANILGKEHRLYNDFKDLTEKRTGYFNWEGKQSDFSTFKHLVTGTILEVTNKSLLGFPKEMESTEIIMFAGFVKWQGEWWFVGDIRSYEKSDELITELSEREEEQNLFIDEFALLTADDKRELITSFIEDSEQKSEDKEDRLDNLWNIFFDERFNADMIKNYYLEGELTGLMFPGKDGDGLFANNLDFTIEYFKRGKLS